MPSESLVLASEAIGFISFFFTLLTWLGVYISLITAMRSTPRTLPLILGNLRQEMLSERSLMRYRLKHGDEYHVFPGRQTRKVGSQESHAKLASETLKYMWREFKDIERQFIVKEDNDVENPKSSDEASGGSENAWGDEKHVGSRSKRTRRLNRRDSRIVSRMGVAEAGLSVDRKTYYNTDLWHRFLWWWKTSEIQSLSDRVQKMQIRRMERDMWETDELVKRGLQILGSMSGDDIYYDDGHEPPRRHRGPKGGGGAADSSSLSERGGQGGFRSRSRVGPSVQMRRQPSGSLRSGMRDVYEKEIIRTRGQSRNNGVRASRVEAVNGSRRQSQGPRRNGPSVVEYEVLYPPPARADTEESRSDLGRQSTYGARRSQQRDRSYSRERSPSRGRR